MGNERDYGSEYDKDKQRYPEFIGGSSKLEKPEPVWMDFGKAVPPPDGYYEPGTIQREAERSGNPYYLTPEQLLAEEEPIAQYQKLGITGYQVSPSVDSSEERTAPPEKKGFLGRMFGGGEKKPEQPSISSPNQSKIREQLDKNTPTGLKPDVYIGQLQLQRQLAKDNGATPKELKQQFSF